MFSIDAMDLVQRAEVRQQMAPCAAGELRMLAARTCACMRSQWLSGVDQTDVRVGLAVKRGTSQMKMLLVSFAQRKDAHISHC